MPDGCTSFSQLLSENIMKCYKHNMISISDALSDLVRGNPFLEFGFRHNLFNLTKLARFLRPQIEARTRKEVQETALTMALSRARRADALPDAVHRRQTLESITVHSGLAVRTYHRSAALHTRLAEIYKRVHARNEFCNLSLGNRQMTIILDARLLDWLDEAVPQASLYQHRDVAAVTARFPEHHIAVPGILYALMQRVTLQNINLIEISSTFTEITFYVAQSDARLLFDTFYQSFSLAGDHRHEALPSPPPA